MIFICSWYNRLLKRGEHLSFQIRCRNNYGRETHIIRLLVWNTEHGENIVHPCARNYKEPSAVFSREISSFFRTKTERDGKSTKFRFWYKSNYFHIWIIYKDSQIYIFELGGKRLLRSFIYRDEITATGQVVITREWFFLANSNIWISLFLQSMKTWQFILMQKRIYQRTIISTFDLMHSYLNNFPFPSSCRISEMQYLLAEMKVYYIHYYYLGLRIFPYTIATGCTD